MENIAILIPCYNEEKTIGAVIEDFMQYLPTAKIYVYDNNSTDKTWDVAESYILKGNVAVVSAPVQGKGHVVKQMFNEIDADIYLMVDGDNTYAAKDAMDLIAAIRKGADMAIGDRLSSTYFMTDVRQFHGMGNKLVRWCVNTMYKGNVSDIMTGYRAFNKKFVKSIRIESPGFEIETEMTIFALKNGYKITSVPVSYCDRPEGSVSKLNTIPDGIKVLETILRMR